MNTDTGLAELPLDQLVSTWWKLHAERAAHHELVAKFTAEAETTKGGAEILSVMTQTYDVQLAYYALKIWHSVPGGDNEAAIRFGVLTGQFGPGASPP